MNLAQSLYELQQAERTIIRNHKRIQKIDKELSQDEGASIAQAAFNEAEEAIKPLREEKNDLQFQLEKTREKNKATEERLYGGTVTNPKEMTEMQQELEWLQRRDADLQARIAHNEEAIALAEANLEEARLNLEQVTAALAEEQQELVQERQQRAEEMERMKTIRTDLITELPDDLVEQYQQMRPRMNGQPVSVMKEDTCTICGVMQISTQARKVRQGDELVTCSNCRRILVYLD